MKSIVFIDTEVSIEKNSVVDLGGCKPDKTLIHTNNFQEFRDFISSSQFICGHNIIKHDLKYIESAVDEDQILIDTLYLSALLFPMNPYHKLVKDDKLQSESLNNPLNDSEKAMDLFFDEVNKIKELQHSHKNMISIYSGLLYRFREFNGFFKYNDICYNLITAEDIKIEMRDNICVNANIEEFIKNNPIELAYALALIKFGNAHSITPGWVLINYPFVEKILRDLRTTPCQEACKYCNENLNIHSALKRYFGFDDFRKYNDENLQEKAVKAALKRKSLITVFPTGGGKSITYQLPAIMAGERTHALTIIISPLQSLMKDQVDNLNKKGILDSVYINGLLSPLERSEVIKRLFEGKANILYISPEQLRSKTVEKIALARTIERIVIDEAHCFSAWGHDFRVDYMYIGVFIKSIQEKKNSKNQIPISCFTATAKQKVISDIKDYFYDKLGLHLEIFAADSERKNLKYHVLYKENEDEKYATLRELIQIDNAPTIVYVSSTKKAEKIAFKLTRDGILSKAYHGKMDTSDKLINQEEFINGKVQVIVATSAFGMGVDKDNVGLIIHHDISNSLENYVQEAGRAGRNPELNAKCYVLYNENDLDIHFLLLNQTKLTRNEIQQIWKAIKDLSKNKKRIMISPLELARKAGWNDTLYEIETKVKIAVGALENSKYIERGKNMTKIFATGLMVKNMEEARVKIQSLEDLTQSQKENMIRIISSLISNKYIGKGQSSEAESRLDYLSDILGISLKEVNELINIMKEKEILANTLDMTSEIFKSKNKTAKILEHFKNLELYIYNYSKKETSNIDIKLLNESALNDGIKSSIKDIRTIIYYWYIKGHIKKYTQDMEHNNKNMIRIIFKDTESFFTEKYQERISICHYIIDDFYKKRKENDKTEKIIINFSLIDIFQNYQKKHPKIELSDIENALLYLSKIEAIELEGGFAVLYNSMEIVRLITDNKIQYKNQDYFLLNEFYKQKVQQIHIVGKYVNMIVKNYQESLEFVKNYFKMNYKSFIEKYFGKEKEDEINRTISSRKYEKVVNELSNIQRSIIDDKESEHIVVAAGPGSGKTKVLVHKLASLLLLEDVKHEELLMLTFSRTAATEFKNRLTDLIGSVSYYVDIKTFHSFCFDVIGRKGSIEKSKNIVDITTKMILQAEVEKNRVSKKVVVIDEAQDMSEDDFELIKALIFVNDEDIKVIAVGDDDQSIYGFRGSSSKYLKELINNYKAKKYEMTTNYRSDKNIVKFSNIFVQSISNRMKTVPCRSITGKNGKVVINKYISPNMEEKVADNLLEEYNPDFYSCVLTMTNEEALRIASTLEKRALPYKLIQGSDDLKLHDLAEIRYFLKKLKEQVKSPKISKEIWEKSKEKLNKKYRKSSCLSNCNILLKEFEKTNQGIYLTDFEEFIYESKYEDFYQKDKKIVTISTIHKAKGREFDKVFIMLKNANLLTEEGKRIMYVALTRAKNELFIHCNNNVLDSFYLPEVIFRKDNNQYEESSNIVMELSYKDVVLDFFIDKKDLITKLYSGYQLIADTEGMYAYFDNQKRKILEYSKRFKEKIEKKLNKGYKIKKGEIRFIVAWKKKYENNKNKEVAVILANLYLEK